MIQVYKLADKEFYCCCSPIITDKDFKTTITTTLKGERKICLWQMKRGNFRGDSEAIIKNQMDIFELKNTISEIRIKWMSLTAE